MSEPNAERGTRRRLGAVLASFALACLIVSSPVAALACSGTGSVMSNKTSYQVGSGMEQFTVFWNGDASCAGSKIRIETRFSIDNQDYKVFAANCPLFNVEGNYCAPTGNGNAWQFVVGNLPTWRFTTPGTGQMVGIIYADGAPLITTPPLTYKIVGQGESLEPAALPPEPPKPIETQLAVAIGGLTQTTDIALYLATVFNWMIPIVAILATTMIAWGGVKWLTAGGDSSRVTSAKTTMSNATIGLVLAFGSYMILSTVNPAMVNFKPIVPTPVERILATAETGCEALVSTHPEYQVSPPIGKCGEKGSVSLRPGMAGTAASNTCDFKTCDAGLGCANVKGVSQCVSCNDFTEDKLKELGYLSGSDSICAKFGPKTSNISGHYSCVYSNDTGLNTVSNLLGQRGCAVMRIDCSDVKSCDDYGKWAALYPQGAPKNGFAVRYERTCLMDLSVSNVCTYTGPSNHLALVCNAHDPCGKGPCHVENNPDISTFEAVTGIAWFKDADLQFCKPD